MAGSKNDLVQEFSHIWGVGGAEAASLCSNDTSGKHKHTETDVSKTSLHMDGLR